MRSDGLLYWIFLSLFLFSACREEEETNVGSLQIVLTEESGAVTRVLPNLSDELAGQFAITLKNTDENQLIFNNTYAEFNREARLCKAGNYVVQAVYGNNPEVALDAPYYTSELYPIIVKSGEEQKIDLSCSVENALAAFEFTNKEKLDKVLKDYYIEIVVGTKSVRWTSGEQSHPYFRKGETVRFYLKGTWIENNQAYSNDFAVIKPAQAGKLYRYKLSVDTSNMTGATFDIQIDASVETVTMNETVPQAWLPKPKITAEGFNESGLMVYTETAQSQMAVISFWAIRPIDDIEFTLDFADPKLSALNKTYMLSSMTQEEKNALRDADISLPELNGSMTGSMELQTGKFLTQEGGSDTDNRIHIRVKANDRWSDESVYTVKTVRPVFTVDVYPGNIWTKEFTINPLTGKNVQTGDFSKFTDISYEFSTDGNSWTSLSSDFRKTGLTPGSTYYVRAKYRGTVPGESCPVNTYPALELENGSLDNWSNANNGKESGSTGNYGAQYEWTGWATLNALTCDYAAGVAAACNSRSGTRPVTGDNAYMGTSAWIVTLGYGYGAWVGNNKYSIWSQLFLGTVTDVDHDNDKCTENHGIEYVSRPTGVRFYYKYAPYDNDRSDIYVKVLSGDIVLGEAHLEQSSTVSSYVEHLLEIQYDDAYKTWKPDKLILVFKSGFNTSIKKIGSNTTAEPRYQGSSLYVDEVSLVYNK